MAANNPVQVVLNDADFFRAPDPGTAGRPTDFFADRDEAFAVHRAKLSAEVEAVIRALARNPAGEVGYVRVRMREKALAKSHRPTRALFQPQTFPCVGAAGLGELFYLASPDTLRTLRSKIDAAEAETRWAASATGGREPNPTAARADTGAIQTIDILPPAEKRAFSAETAVAWLSDPTTGGSYIIELFEEPARAERLPGPSRGQLGSSLRQLLERTGARDSVRALPSPAGSPAIAARVNSDLVSGRDGEAARTRPVTLATSQPSSHEAFLEAVAAHPSVRRISLPVKLELSQPAASPVAGGVHTVPPPQPDGLYPNVGVIDTGLAEPLQDWVLGRHDFLDEDDVDGCHGTFIGGLLVSGKALNAALPGLEADGCRLVDLALFPKSDFASFYPRGFDDFLEEVDQAVGEAVANHGTRVFNLSINAISPVEGENYSYYAARLDEIATRHSVVFVNSAGNLPHADRRAPWPAKPGDVLKYFAARTTPDTIHKPCESHLSVAVGAINPPGMTGHVHGAPTTYTRRGPGLKVGCKPDVAHYGGSEDVGTPAAHGLHSLNIDGTVGSSCGTSFAAPLVAKTLATLDSRIETRLPPHTLRAMMVHHAETPSALIRRGMGNLARQFVGFGVPPTVEQMLVTDDNAITLVFSSRLPDDPAKPRPKVLRFPFAWPPGLVDPETGACHGALAATLIYEPPIDRAFGAEFVRVNLDCKIQQRQPEDSKDGKPRYLSVLQQSFLPRDASAAIPEKELIKQGLKWWPTKRYKRQLPVEGLGSLSEWQIEVSSVRRQEAAFPAAGIPFSLIVTISDPTGAVPVFQEMRRTLRTQQVRLEDIRLEQRLRVMGRS